MAANNTDGWKKIAIEQIKKNRLVTSYRGLDTSEVPYKDSSNYKVFENSPNLELDQGQTYLISGTESQIILQSSLIKALHDMLGNRLGYSINFDEWFEDFELEFKIDPRTGRSRIPVRTEAEILKFTYWGGAKDERPKFEYLDIPDERRRTKEDEKLLWYRVIRFWKNRNLLNDYYVLAGTPTELREQIFYLMNGGGGGGTTASDENSKYSGHGISFHGKPLVTLYFQEPSEDVEEGYRALRTQISFRIMDKSDDPRSPLPRLTAADVRLLATQIRDIFASPPYRIHRGKETVSIRDKERGYESYIHVFNRQDGIDLYTKICQVQAHTINLKRVFHKVTLDEVGAYPTLPAQVQVLGQTVKEPRIRPVGWVNFTEAKLFVSLIDTPIKLCDAHGFLFSGVELNP